jgi:signal transduction histidine kinase
MSALVMLLLVFLVNYILSDRLVRPLRQMSAAMRRYAAGDFSARVQTKGKDEVAQLAESLNAMAVSLSAEEETHRSFVANVSHELKTPMTSIAGFVDGILDGTIPPERQAHYLRIVSDETKRLSRLVTAMLNLSRIDAGKLAVNATSFDLCEAVVGALLSLEQPITDRKLSVEGLEDCPRMPVCTDRDLLGQVVYNLLENAAKFSNEGGLIRITLRHADNRVYCTVWNSGDGIPAPELPHVFERFYKTDKSRGLDKNGLGLGLYLTHNIVRLLGGEITVRSAEGRWCAFEFWLPEDESAVYLQGE